MLRSSLVDLGSALRRNLAAPLTLLVALTTGCATDIDGEVEAEPETGATAAGSLRSPADLAALLEGARRIPTAAAWFEVLELPNDVYALWEPGHAEKVNSFLIIGSERDVLYDTGMGIGSIGAAILDVRKAQGLPDHELMVINSHNHLDHNAGNTDFDVAWIIEDEWGIAKLTEGIPASGDGAFVPYWDQLTPHPGITTPADFDPETFSIPPFPRDNIRFLADGDIVDLGNRQFEVLHTTAHSPDGLALYDAETKILFGGDTFIGSSYLIRDLELLAQDLDRVSRLEIDFHYSSHGSQLVEVMMSGAHLAIVRRMIEGERTESETVFAGSTLPLYELEGVEVIEAGDFLTY